MNISFVKIEKYEVSYNRKVNKSSKFEKKRKIKSFRNLQLKIFRDKENRMQNFFYFFLIPS